MRENLELDRYLERLRESGQVDSEGCFTMAGDRAVGTLSRFLLPSPGDWLLKIVQSACAGGSKELKIRQTRLSTQVQFRLPDLVDLNLLERCFVDPSIQPQNRGIHHLIIGLRALQAAEGRTWVARIVSGEERSLLQCLSGSVSARRETEPAPLEGAKIELAATYPPDDFGKIAGVRFGGSSQEEHLSLLSRARACPIALLFDGRRIDDLGDPSISGLQTRLYLGVTFSQDNPDGIAVPSRVRTLVGRPMIGDRLNAHSPFFYAQPPTEGRVGAIVCWYFNYTVLDDVKRKTALTQKNPSGSRVLLIHDGVVVSSRSLGIHHPISTDILLNGDHLTPDLSGLQIDAQSEHVHFAKLELKEALAHLPALSRRLKEHYPRPSLPHLLLYGGLGAAGLMFPVLGAKLAVGGYSLLKLHLSARERKALLNLAVEALEEYERSMGY